MIEYLRPPSSPFVEITAKPIFLPTVPEMNPRTVCGCQPVTFMISASVAPLARFISAITSACLFEPSGLVLRAFFLAAAAFFVGLAFLVGLLYAFGGSAATAGVFCRLNRGSLLFSMTGLRSFHIDRSGREELQLESGDSEECYSQHNWRHEGLFIEWTKRAGVRVPATS